MVFRRIQDTPSTVPTVKGAVEGQESSEAPALPPAFSTRSYSSARRSTLSTMTTKDMAPDLRRHNKSSTIPTFVPQADEKQTPSATSSSKPKESTITRKRRVPERDATGKFILLANKTTDKSGSTAEAKKKTPKNDFSSKPAKLQDQGKNVADSPEEKVDSAEDSPYPSFEDRYRPQWEHEPEPEGEDESGQEGSSWDFDDDEGSEYKI